MTTTNPDPQRLRLELDDHRKALDEFIASANAVAAEAWNQPRGSEKWSPAQVAEHLRLSYTTIRAELAGAGGFRIRTSWWQQWLYRLLYLQRILRDGRFPKGVPATREIRPENGPFDRQQLLASLHDEGEQFMADVTSAARAGTATVSHPFLGKLGLLEGLRLTTQHIRHHHPQLLPEQP